MTEHFPVIPRHDGDDLILADPNVGDHDARSEDRQIVFDALLAAKDHLLITYTGRDERSNLRETSCGPGRRTPRCHRPDRQDRGPEAPRDRIVVNHPLQPFDARNFIPGGLVGPGPWSFEQGESRGEPCTAAAEESDAGAPGFLREPPRTDRRERWSSSVTWRPSSSRPVNRVLAL